MSMQERGRNGAQDGQKIFTRADMRGMAPGALLVMAPPAHMIMLLGTSSCSTGEGPCLADWAGGAGCCMTGSKEKMPGKDGDPYPPVGMAAAAGMDTVSHRGWILRWGGRCRERPLACCTVTMIVAGIMAGHPEITMCCAWGLPLRTLRVCGVMREIAGSGPAFALCAEVFAGSGRDF